MEECGQTSPEELEACWYVQESEVREEQEVWRSGLRGRKEWERMNRER